MFSSVLAFGADISAYYLSDLPIFCEVLARFLSWLFSMDGFICICLFIHLLVNEHLSSFRLRAVASNAARNMTCALRRTVRCISDDIYLTVELLVIGKVQGQLLCLMPKSFSKEIVPGYSPTRGT